MTPRTRTLQLAYIAFQSFSNQFSSCSHDKLQANKLKSFENRGEVRVLDLPRFAMERWLPAGGGYSRWGCGKGRVNMRQI